MLVFLCCLCAFLIGISLSVIATNGAMKVVSIALPCILHLMEMIVVVCLNVYG